MLFREHNEGDELLPFSDRTEAGRILATRLSIYSGHNDVIVLGLPRGGVPAAFEVAQALHIPVDVFVVRKLGTSWHKEVAMGSIAPQGVQVLDITDNKIVSLGRGDSKGSRHGAKITEAPGVALPRRAHATRRAR